MSKQEDSFRAEDDSTQAFAAEELLPRLRLIFRAISMDVESYIRRVIVPSLLTAIVFTAIGAAGLVPGFDIANLLVPILGWFLFVTACVYPYALRQRKAKEVRENFYLFITHLTALAMSNVKRMEIFRQLAREEQYGALAEEMNRIVVFVDTWNQSLDNACLVLAKRTSSDLLSKFLERLAYNVGAGQSIDQFLLDEQSAIIQQYSTRYRADLDQIEVFADTYLSFMLSLTFAMIFSIIAPIITGAEPFVLISGVLVLFVFFQVGFALLIHATSPEDFLIFTTTEYQTEEVYKRRIATIAAIVPMIILAVIITLSYIGYLPVQFQNFVPESILLAIPTTPCVLSGYYIGRIESNIKARDNQFSGFIRGLGATEAIKQSSTATVLRGLQNKDFGSLTDEITNLYRRLSSRAGNEQAYALFSAETGSYLIRKFIEMYRLGRSFGGDTRELSEIISSNFQEVLELREYREQVTSTLTGLLYGLVGTSAFAFFVTSEIVRTLVRLSEDVRNDQLVGDVINTSVYSLPTIEALLVTTVISTAIVSSIIIRISKRESLAGGLIHFGLLVWLSMIAVYLARLGGEFLQLS